MMAGPWREWNSIIDPAYSIGRRAVGGNRAFVLHRDDGSVLGWFGSGWQWFEWSRMTRKVKIHG